MNDLKLEQLNSSEMTETNGGGFGWWYDIVFWWYGVPEEVQPPQ